MTEKLRRPSYLFSYLTHLFFFAILLCGLPCFSFLSLDSASDGRYKQDLPEPFENSMSDWMEGFHTYLIGYSNPLLDQPEGSEAPGPVERVQVCTSGCVTRVDFSTKKQTKTIQLSSDNKKSGFIVCPYSEFPMLLQCTSFGYGRRHALIHTCSGVQDFRWLCAVSFRNWPRGREFVRRCDWHRFCLCSQTYFVLAGLGHSGRVGVLSVCPSLARPLPATSSVTAIHRCNFPLITGSTILT